MRFKVIARYQEFRDRTELGIFCEGARSGKETHTFLQTMANDRSMAVPLVFEPVPEPLGEVLHPTLTLHTDDMDQLLAEFAAIAWQRGWRPDNWAQSAPATERHLEDMRTLVFDRLMPQRGKK